MGEILSFTDDGKAPGASPKLPPLIDVAAIRRKTGLSQTAFALQVGVAVGTIRNWEHGRRLPQGPARILLALLDRNPKVIEDTLGAE
nr:helix-turn-helix domain-containing protein [Microvirga splendida]